MIILQDYGRDMPPYILDKHTNTYLVCDFDISSSNFIFSKPT